MKIIYGLIFITGLFGLTSCPRYPLDLTPCSIPDSLLVDSGCYNSSKGLTLHISKIMPKDSTIKIEWSIRLLADSLANFGLAPQLHYFNTSVVTLADLDLGKNTRLYVEVSTTCSAAKKYPGVTEKVFVKRYKMNSDCYQWEEGQL